MLTRIAIVSLLLQAGCVAPQRPGAARTTYLTMATADGAMAGGFGGLLGCSFLTGEIWQHGGGNSKAAQVCGLGGAVAGGAGALFGSLNSDREPDRATWVVVSLPAVLLGASLVASAVALVVDQFRR